MNRNPITAIIVAEVFDARDVKHPLYPITQTPVALAPIANVCLIDYLLENLLRSGVQKAYIINNASTFTEVKMHLENSKNGRGKSWLESKELQVVHLASKKLMANFFDASLSIVEQNIVGELESFVWVPIDAVCNIANLKDMFSRHRLRMEFVNGGGSLKYAATMVAAREHSLVLADVHHTVTRQAIAACRKVAAPPAAGFQVTPQTPLPGSFDGCGAYHESVVPEKLLQCAMTVSYDEQSDVVRAIQRWEAGGESLPRFPLHELKKTRLIVRTDLCYTGIMILSPGALSIFKFFMKESFDYFTYILNHVETEPNCFGLEIAPTATTVLPITTLPGYIAANVAVAMRRLYPMTKESNFANSSAEYSVAHFSPTVCLHRTSRTGVIGPHVVVGAETLVPTPATVIRSIIGNNCSFGENVTIVDSVILDYVHIGDRCQIRNSVVCSSVQVPASTYITECIIGRGVSFKAAGSGGAASYVQLNNVRIEPCPPGVPASAPSGAVGLLVPATSTTATTGGIAVQPLAPAALFSSDNTAVVQNDCEADKEDEADEAFLEAVRETVATALRSPSQVHNTTYALKDVRTSHQKHNGDVARAVVELMLRHVADHNTDPKEALRAVSAIFAQWCTPFFKVFVLLETDMAQVLAGVAVALHGPAYEVLFGKSAKVLEQLYCDCEPDLFEGRGWCVVSGPALVAFDTLSEAYAAIPEADRTPEQAAIATVGEKCIKYLDSVRSYLEDA